MTGVEQGQKASVINNVNLTMYLLRLQLSQLTNQEVTGQSARISARVIKRQIKYTTACYLLRKLKLKCETQQCEKS